MQSAAGPSSERTRVKRMPPRAVYDRPAIDAILAEGLICHVGFVAEGHPYVIPTIYAPMGERLLIHGSAASRTLRAARGGISLCVTITLLDGIVLARSAYHHSMNYRSVMIFGVASEIAEREEKLAAMRALVEHVAAGRWADVRPPSEDELRATMVLSLPIDEVSAKVRSGPPVDDEDDYVMRVWAGVLPLILDARGAIADPRMPPDIAIPEYARSYRRRFPSVTGK